jgi:hypothetical protein
MLGLGSPNSSGNSFSAALAGGPVNAGNLPQSLDQLLERQWEQGSQFLMEQAQHFDSMVLFFVKFIDDVQTEMFSCIIIDLLASTAS